MFVFGDFNVHHNDWLTYSVGTDRLVNFVISNVNLHMLLKQSITSQKLAKKIANNVLKKSKSAITSLFDGPEVLSSASDKAKLFGKNFSKNSNLDDSGISLPVFISRTN